MREIGAFEAKSRLGQLLDWVEAGEEVVITRRGRVVAKLVPPDAGSEAGCRFFFAYEIQLLDAASLAQSRRERLQLWRLLVDMHSHQRADALGLEG